MENTGPISIDRILQSINQYSRLQGASRGFNEEKPVEIFRKDLISAMKLPDAEPLTKHLYWPMADNWRMEWEKGVQVPVEPEKINFPDLTEIADAPVGSSIALPDKLLISSKEEWYNPDRHEVSRASNLEEEVCRYDLDDLDTVWLRLLNEQRQEWGLPAIIEWTMERIMERLEMSCHENMQQKIRTSEGLGIEYDEDIVCDVCQMPDGEDGNEMVFCDGCDLCVHQACYGIQEIPEGAWLCRVCSIGLPPQQCMLCPAKGGAMKATRGNKWAHVSCALWIPEVSIGNPDKMEPVTQISRIPASRWSLLCYLCRERSGCCIQCQVRSCTTAFHVTCAFQRKLIMHTIVDEETDDIQLKAYCIKHSISEFPDEFEKNQASLSAKELRMTREEKDNARQQRIVELENVFYTLVEPRQIAVELNMDAQLVELVYAYWKLKRKSRFNKALLMPKAAEAALLHRSQQEDGIVARMKMFVRLRQDLERVRNLIYMVLRREKFKRMFEKCQRQLFLARSRALFNKNIDESQATELASISDVHSVYSMPEVNLANAAVDNALIQEELEEQRRLLAEDKPSKYRALKSPHKRKRKQEEENGEATAASNVPKKRKQETGTPRSSFGTRRADAQFIIDVSIRERVNRNLHKIRNTWSFLKHNRQIDAAQRRLHEYNQALSRIDLSSLTPFDDSKTQTETISFDDSDLLHLDSSHVLIEDSSEYIDTDVPASEVSVLDSDEPVRVNEDGNLVESTPPKADCTSTENEGESVIIKIPCTDSPIVIDPSVLGLDSIDTETSIDSLNLLTSLAEPTEI